MKRTVLTAVAVVALICIAFSMVACSGEGDLWGISGIKTKDVVKIEIVNSGGAIKTLEGDRLTSFMNDIAALKARKDDNGYPDKNYDYKLRIYFEGKEGYAEYLFGQEMKKVNTKYGVKESFYYFEDYNAARDVVSKYFYQM